MNATETQNLAAAHVAPKNRTKMKIAGLSVRYGDQVALHDVDLDVHEHEILALIGPSGCGKTTLVRSLNRMHDTVPSAKVRGSVELDGVNIYHPTIDPVWVRKRVGMVFQRPFPFPKSIRENVAYGLRVAGIRAQSVLDAKVEIALKQAALWDEVKDRLDQSGLALSGGQQQRLCVARALAVDPDVLLMDEPASALDPIATAKIEDLIAELRKQLTIVIVTHNMQQAARVSQRTAFFYQGHMVEIGDTTTMFTKPRERQTEDYISGRFG